MHGLHADFRHRGLPAGGGELDRDRDEYKLSPEAFAGYRDLPYYVTQATWSSPVTNKVLTGSRAFLAGFHYRYSRASGKVPPDEDPVI